jgi:hypothetical protein
MKKTLSIVLVAGALALAGPGYSLASPLAVGRTYTLSAAMNTRQVVTPANKPFKAPADLAHAAGLFTGMLTGRGNHMNLTWQLTYSGVGRSPVAIADIHLGKPGAFGQVLVRLCDQCTAGQKGSVAVTTLTAQAITSGSAWITLITFKYPNGAIRGQIRAKAR